MIDGSIRDCLESFGVWMKDTIGTPKKKKSDYYRVSTYGVRF